jgi:hypothetical protein
VIWPAGSFAKSSNLDVYVNSETNKIHINSNLDANGSYNLVDGEVLNFIIRGILPSMDIYDFSFPLIIYDLATCTVTLPQVSS